MRSPSFSKCRSSFKTNRPARHRFGVHADIARLRPCRPSGSGEASATRAGSKRSMGGISSRLAGAFIAHHRSRNGGRTENLQTGLQTGVKKPRHWLKVAIPAGFEPAIHGVGIRYSDFAIASVRLGRSLTDLLRILQGLHEKGVGLFLHQQGLDTSTTAGKAMFQMLAPGRMARSSGDAELSPRSRRVYGS